jgi:phosphatidate cytidylyltransferase
MGIFQKNKISLKSFGVAALGLVYISLCWGLMMDLHSSEKIYDIHLHDTMYVFTWSFVPIVIVASIWINDTMAYIVGSLIGRTQLSKISPKKTWEGTIGGIILSTLLIYFFWNLLILSTPGLFMNVITGVIAFVSSITGTLGDLFESKLKRMAGVKDSGSFMPGHGGFLDRFDSLLFAVPAVWVFLYFIFR